MLKYKRNKYLPKISNCFVDIVYFLFNSIQNRYDNGFKA